MWVLITRLVSCWVDAFPPDTVIVILIPNQSSWLSTFLIMKFVSTRGTLRGLSFEDALMSTGFLRDGGLLLPERIPTISADTLTKWSTLSYPELVTEVVSLYVSEDEIPRVELTGVIERAFRRFRHEDVVPVTKLKDGLHVHELFHGITYAFKDLALSCVGQFMDYFLSKRKKRIIILVVTSGDTGSAALEAVRGSKWIDIIVMLPKDRCSRVQELMMTTVLEDNCHLYRVDGNCDDLDEVMKAVLTDENYCKKHSITTINSVNWARIMVQIAHHIYGYLKVCRSIGETVETVIPTGGCGNLSGATIAMKMGLPIKITTAVNDNDIVARTFRDGDWSANEVKMTISPAMDIQCPYNLERVFYLLSGRDTDLINQLAEEFESSNSKVQLPSNLLTKIHDAFSTFCADESTTVATMKRCWEENGYLLCPHTATAVACHYERLDSRSASSPPRICLATASPAKFTEAVEGAAGLTPQLPDDIKALYTMPTKFEELVKGDNWNKVLRGRIEEITKSYS
ncbi:threonine synthase-like 2 [Lineus longissimus]|uniref:threonine synthase-like 2 n=1 Tax=Lineus longissimus TaxID=88925 RepID=UPI002B4E868B